MKSGAQTPWVVVLAAGEGTRVKSLTKDAQGRPAPKQYTSVDGTTTLLGATLARAERIAPRQRIVTIVAAQHAHWWESELSGYPPENTIVQPENRGTAAGILLPELLIARRSECATVVILPSDHYVGHEEVLHESLCRAVSAVTRGDAPAVMLGVRPCGPEEEYGWIVPCPGPDNCPHRVASFREKPDACTAASLLDRGGLLNTFIIVGDSRCMLSLFQQKTPDLWRRFERLVGCGTARSWPPEGLDDLYRSIPSLDFSKDILEESAEQLWVYPVPPCGWTDLGTPRRLQEHMVQSAERAPRLAFESATG